MTKLVVLLWAHPKKAEFFGKDTNPWETGRQQEKRKADLRLIDSMKAA